MNLEKIKPEIEKAFEQAYINEDTKYNTDIIVYNDGSVTTNNYFGSVDYRDSCIEFVYSVTSQMKQSFKDWVRDGLNEEQKEYCDVMGWLSMWQTNSDNKEDWEEFSIEDIDWRDTWDYFVEKYEDSLCY